MTQIGLGPISIPPPLDFRRGSADERGAQSPSDPAGSPASFEGLRASDLPAPMPLPDVELAKPAGPMVGLDDIDLPGIIGAPIAEDEIELSGRGRTAQTGGDWDLPAPYDPGAGGVDLPASLGSRSSHEHADLPSPVRTRHGLEDLDLPAPSTSGRLGSDFDLPALRSSSDPAADFDLPRPKGGSSEARRFHSPRTGLSDLGEEIDLPMGRSDAELPAPVFGDVDLPTPALGEANLPILREDFAEGDAGIEIESFERRHGAGPIELDMASEELSLELLDEEGGAAQEAPGRHSPPALPGSAAIDDFDGDAFQGDEPGASSAAAAGRVDGARAAVAKVQRQRKKIVLPPWFGLAAAVAAALGLLVGAGFYLGGTEYGLFGIHLVEPFLPGSGDPAEISEGISASEQLLASDTYDDSRTAIAQLTALQARAQLNQTLAARRLLHESLFQVRFGRDVQSQQRIDELQGFLRARGDRAPGIQLANAAVALNNGDLAAANAHLAQAKPVSGADAYFDLVSAELALRQGEAQVALDAFQRAFAKSPTARAQWGISRAQGLLGDADKQAEAARQTLVQSPDHAAAQVIVARVLIASGDEEEALKLLEGPAGLKEGHVALASVAERSDALGLLAEVEERRGRRGVARQTYEKAAQMNPGNIKAALGAARLILDEGSYQEAYTRFQALINAGVSDSAPAHVTGKPALLIEAKLGAVRALLLMGQAKEAQGLLADLQTDKPIDPELELWQGKVAEGLGDGDAAVKHYRNAMELDETFFPAHVSLSQYYASKGRPDEAIKVLMQAEKHVEMNAEVHRVRGQAELARNRVEDAIVQFQKALAEEPLDASSAFGLAVAYRRLGRLEEATSALVKVEEIDAAYPGLALEKGLLAEARGEMETAAASYRAALKASPQDMALKSRLGAVLTMTKQLDDAERFLAEVLQEQPYSAEAEHYLGRIALLRGQKSVARQHFLRAARLEPQNGVYRLYVGWAAFESNEFASALRNFKAAIKIDPSLGDAYWLRGRIGLRTGAVRDAAADFEKALQLTPTRTEAYADMGEAYDQLGKSDKAIEAYTKAVESEPQNASWWYRLGRLQLDQGQEAPAISSLTTAITLADEQATAPAWAFDAHRLLGDAHRAAGAEEQAIASYERYLQTAPRDAGDREYVKALLRRMKP